MAKTKALQAHVVVMKVFGIFEKEVQLVTSRVIESRTKAKLAMEHLAVIKSFYGASCLLGPPDSSTLMVSI